MKFKDLLIEEKVKTLNDINPIKGSEGIKLIRKYIQQSDLMWVEKENDKKLNKDDLLSFIVGNVVLSIGKYNSKIYIINDESQNALDEISKVVKDLQNTFAYTEIRHITRGVYKDYFSNIILTPDELKLKNKTYPSLGATKGYWALIGK